MPPQPVAVCPAQARHRMTSEFRRRFWFERRVSPVSYIELRLSGPGVSGIFLLARSVLRESILRGKDSRSGRDASRVGPAPSHNLLITHITKIIDLELGGTLGPSRNPR